MSSLKWERQEWTLCVREARGMRDAREAEKRLSRARACFVHPFVSRRKFSIWHVQRMHQRFFSWSFVLYETEELCKQRSFSTVEFLRFVEPVVVLATHKKHKPLKLTNVRKMHCLFLMVFGQQVTLVEVLTFGQLIFSFSAVRELFPLCSGGLCWNTKPLSMAATAQASSLALLCQTVFT